MQVCSVAINYVLLKALKKANLDSFEFHDAPSKYY